MVILVVMVVVMVLRGGVDGEGGGGHQYLYRYLQFAICSWNIVTYPSEEGYAT